MIVDRARYARKATTDLETAMAEAVLRAVDVDHVGPGGRDIIRFRELFSDWPSFEDQVATPSICVVPGADILYGPSHPTPRLLEDTWQKDVALGLYELKEGQIEFDVEFRGGNTEERNALKASLETCFATIGSARPGGGTFNARVVEMPEYWGLGCTMTLVSSMKLDDAETAKKGIAEGRMVVRASAPLVRLDVVQPFRVRIRTVVDPAP